LREAIEDIVAEHGSRSQSDGHFVNISTIISVIVHLRGRQTGIQLKHPLEDQIYCLPLRDLHPTIIVESFLA